MTIKSLFSKKYPKPVLIYTNIDDLPIYNWFKINETNDLKWIVINQDERDKADPVTLENAFKLIRTEHFTVFGIPKDMKKMYQLVKSKLLAECELIISQDKIHLTFINLYEAQLRELRTEISKKQSSDFSIVVAYVERYLHIQIDERKTSVRKFYGYFRIMEDEAKRKKHQSNVG